MRRQAHLETALLCCDLCDFIHSFQSPPPPPTTPLMLFVGLLDSVMHEGMESLCRGFAGMQDHGCARLFSVYFGFAGWRTWSSAGTSPFAKM